MRLTLSAKAIAAVVALGSGVVMSAWPVIARDDAPDAGVICNPVYDGERSPVLTKKRSYVRHRGSAACPQPAPEPEPVAAAAPKPEPAPRLEAVVIAISSDVAFDFDRSDIKPAVYGELDDIAAGLTANPDTRLRVIGHTDSMGSEIYNEALSLRRAEAVAAYLMEAGVLPGRMTVQGMSEAQPITSNKTEDGRALNRRVEIHSL